MAIIICLSSLKLKKKKKYRYFIGLLLPLIAQEEKYPYSDRTDSLSN